MQLTLMLVLLLLMATRNRTRKPPGMVLKPVVNNGINCHTNWCRISSINSIIVIIITIIIVVVFIIDDG